MFVMMQAYAGAPSLDNKESITWARFEYADINDPTFYPDYNEGSSTPPLLLVLGYTTGVQVNSKKNLLENLCFFFNSNYST